MAATFQRHSGGRLLLNVVTGGESREQRAYGDFLDKDERYARYRGVPRRSCGALWRGRDRRPSTARTSASRRRCCPACPSRCLRSTSAAPRPAAGDGRGPARRRLPHLGRAAGRRWPEKLEWIRGSPPSTAASSASASACTSSPATPPRRPGPRPSGCSTAGPRRRSRRVQAGLAPQRVRGPAADAGAARRLDGDLEVAPNLWAGVGLVRGGAGHGAGRQPRARSPTGSREYHDARASTSSSSPATRTSRRRAGSARACCRSSPGAGCGPLPRQGSGPARLV